MVKEVTKTIIKEVHKETSPRKEEHHPNHPNHPQHPQHSQHQQHPQHLHHVIHPKHQNSSQISKQTRLEEKVIENLVELQKSYVSAAEKFDNLSKQISTLLGLFENAAKSFAANPAIQASDKDREFLDKVDKLLEQNKLIAKGLTLMEEKMREKVYGSPAPMPAPMPQPRVEEKERTFVMPDISPNVKEEDSDEEFRPSIGKPLPKF